MPFKRFCLAAAAILLAAGCNDGGGGPASVFNDIQYFRITSKAQEAYPHLPKHEAQRRFARAEFDRRAVALETAEEKRALAAAFYLGFSGVNGRAIPAYCGKMNLDLSTFVKGFASQNKREERAYNAFLETQGMTADDAWERIKRPAMSAAKNQLMEAGGLSKGSYGVCRDVEENPYRYLANAKFSQYFPTAARLLTARAES